MPRVKNMVEWCLRKADAEIKKGEMHRGLLKMNLPIAAELRGILIINSICRCRATGY